MLVLSLFVLLGSFIIFLCLLTKFFELLFFVVLDLFLFLCRFGLVGINIFFWRSLRFCIFVYVFVPVILIFFGCIYLFEFFVFPRLLFGLFKGCDIFLSLLLGNLSTKLLVPKNQLGGRILHRFECTYS